MKIVKNVLKTHRTKISKHFIMFFMFLAIVLGKGTDVIAQERQQEDELSHVDFSNPVMTTDCCQLMKQRMDSIINNAPYVFEGRMIKKENGSCDDYYLFEVEKVYRGGERLQAGTVEVIARCPREPGDPPTAGFLPRWCILFAKEIEGGRGAFDANNSIKLELFYINDKYHTSGFGETAERVYDDRGEFVRYKKTYYGSFAALFRTKEEVRDFIGTYGLFPMDIQKADKLKTFTWREIESGRTLSPLSREENEERCKRAYKQYLEEQWKLESASGRKSIQQEVEDAMRDYENASE